MVVIVKTAASGRDRRLRALHLKCWRISSAHSPFVAKEEACSLCGGGCVCVFSSLKPPALAQLSTLLFIKIGTSIHIPYNFLSPVLLPSLAIDLSQKAFDLPTQLQHRLIPAAHPIHYC